MPLRNLDDHIQHLFIEFLLENPDKLNNADLLLFEQVRNHPAGVELIKRIRQSKITNENKYPLCAHGTPKFIKCIQCIEERL